MRRMFRWLSLLPIFITSAVLAAPIAPVAVPPTRPAKTVITATIWNIEAVGLYSYINNTLAATLNCLTTKGDIYVYNGSTLTRQPAGTDGQVLTADSGSATGLSYGAFADGTALGAKGDLLGYSTGPAAIAVGADGTVLTADSTSPTGVSWQTPVTSTPTGVIVAWSPVGAGTNTIPSGWALCDGQAHGESSTVTPNLIGKFIIGTRPSGSTATPATGGFGAYAVDGPGGGSATHTHTFSASGTTSIPHEPAPLIVPAGTIYTPGAEHTHTFTITGTTNAQSTEPSDYALVYIMKVP